MYLDCYSLIICALKFISSKFEMPFKVVLNKCQSHISPIPRARCSARMHACEDINNQHLRQIYKSNEIDFSIFLSYKDFLEMRKMSLLTIMGKYICMYVRAFACCLI